MKETKGGAGGGGLPAERQADDDDTILKSNVPEPPPPQINAGQLAPSSDDDNDTNNDGQDNAKDFRGKGGSRNAAIRELLRELGIVGANLLLIAVGISKPYFFQSPKRFGPFQPRP